MVLTAWGMKWWTLAVRSFVMGSAMTLVVVNGDPKIAVATPATKSAQTLPGLSATFGVPGDGKFPAAAVAWLLAHSPVPVMCPTELSGLQSRGPGEALAVTLDTDAQGYGADIFWRPAHSHTRTFSDATFEGSFQGRREDQEKWFDSVIHLHVREPMADGGIERTVRLPSGKKAIWVHVDKVQDDAFFWSSGRWQYLTHTFGAYSQGQQALSFARTIDTWTVRHGPVVRGVMRGFVLADQNGNRPSFVVGWTFGDGVWYEVALQRLPDAMRIAQEMMLVVAAPMTQPRSRSTIAAIACGTGVTGRPNSFSKSSLTTSSAPSRMARWMATKNGMIGSGTPAPAMISAYRSSSTCSTGTARPSTSLSMAARSSYVMGGPDNS
ncbi:hypothetical protein [Alicyclobacillus cellulosilyticus]|uniref:hypothetical protein n=1 Tax=Alicyclobacillus cellulosilyticus TaxID=1003997 RepID=UPI001669F6BE|nr:hypothetical protein [Alicyclobacillus cellulosilyticus]